MRKIIILLQAAIILAACGKNDGHVSGMVDISISGSHELYQTRGMSLEEYRELANRLNYDAVSIFVHNTPNNKNMIFTMSNESNVISLDGKLYMWEGKRKITAVSPYDAKGYEINDNAIYIDITKQIAIEENGVASSQSVHVGTIDEFTTQSTNNNSIAHMQFMRPSTLLGLEIEGIPSDESIFEVGLITPNKKILTASANIALSNMQILDGERNYTCMISVSILNQHSKNLKIEFSILPDDLTEETIFLYVKTLRGGEHHTYHREIECIKDFKRCESYAISDKPLNLTQDFSRGIIK